MPGEVSETVLFQLSRVVVTHLGLSYPRDRFADLERALIRAAKELGFEDCPAYARWLMAPLFQGSRIEAMARFLTVGETHFFRDEKLFALLEERLLPDLISARRTEGRLRLRIWSAGCATGEEAYSLAILLKKLIPDLRAWDITIKGTDVNDDFLVRAREGKYSQWSFRSVPPGIVERYFVEEDGVFTISPDIRAMVDFSYLNLVKDPYPFSTDGSDCADMIFCRNVLMYFSTEWQERVISRLSESLSAGGWFVVNPAEASTVDRPELRHVNYPGVVLFRKNGGDPEPWTRPLFHFAVSLPETSVPVTMQFLLPSPASVDSSRGEGIRLATVEPVKPIQPVPAKEPDPCVDENSFRDAVRMYEDGLYLRATEKLLSALDEGRLNRPECGAAMALVSRAYANVGKLDEALEWSEKTVAVEKLNSDYHYFHGTVLQELGRIEDAVNAMTRAVFLDPDLVVAHFALGHLFRGMGKPKDSERHFKTALSILSGFGEDEAVPASDGLTAGRLREIIVALTRKEALNGNQ